MPLNLQHQTAAQFVTRLREKWRNASKEETAKLATWILDRIAGGDFTDAQLRAVFGLNTTQWNTLKSKMTTLRTQWLAIQVAKGE